MEGLPIDVSRPSAIDNALTIGMETGATLKIILQWIFPALLLSGIRGCCFDSKKGKITKGEYEIKICIIFIYNADLFYLFLDDNFCLIKITFLNFAI